MYTIMFPSIELTFFFLANRFGSKYLFSKVLPTYPYCTVQRFFAGAMTINPCWEFVQVVLKVFLHPHNTAQN